MRSESTMSGQHFQIVGRYLLGSPIASGGMATVYLGRPLNLPRAVAIKRLSPDLARDETFVRMFLDEIQLLCRIRHKNVVAPIEHFQHGGEFFIVMEYVEGLSLAQLSGADEGPLDVHLASKIMCGVLTGLDAAHEAVDCSGQPLNMVHRDVSPHNILVGTDGESRIADFGIAKAAWRAHVTQHGERKGKPGYMAPEQWAFREVDRRTDVYAAGVVLWELLTGTRLFPDQPMHHASAAFDAEIAAPSTLASALPRELDDVALRALAVEREDRFQEAKQMAAALRAAAIPARDLELGAWVTARGKKELARRGELITELESLRPSELTPVNRGYSVPEYPAAVPDAHARRAQESAPPAEGRFGARAHGGFKPAAVTALTIVVGLLSASYLAQSRNPQPRSDERRPPPGVEHPRVADDHGGVAREPTSPAPPIGPIATDRGPASLVAADRAAAVASSVIPLASIAPSTPRAPAPPAAMRGAPSRDGSTRGAPAATARNAAAVSSAAPLYDPLRDARRR